MHRFAAGFHSSGDPFPERFPFIPAFGASWRAASEKAPMKPDRKYLAELVGGPEDGMMVDVSKVLASAPKLRLGESGPEIPLIFSSEETPGLQSEDPAEFVFLGMYVREAGSGPAKYRWVGV